jgi:hypothetical protein
MKRGLRVVKPLQVPQGAPANRAEWEAKLVSEASYFTCSIPCTDPRPRGHRLQWNVANHPTLLAAVQAASVNPRALVYAVGAKGDSCPLSRADWTSYLKLRGEQQ